jgi:cytochrome P450
MTITIPHSDIDLYCDESILAPYEGYRMLRESGPAVMLDRYGVYAVARYRDVYDALHDHETFISGAGVAMDEGINQRMQGTTIATDPPLHDHIRGITGKPLTAKALGQYRQSIQERADGFVDQLIERGAFDASVDFAQVFPMSVVPDLVGWPAEGREHFLDWGSALLEAFGPINERALSALPALQDMWEYLERMSVPGELKADGWAARLLDEAEAGVISKEMLPGLLGDYLAPALDTTVRVLATSLWLFGNHPDQWEILREDPSLVPNAFNEVLRIETPFSGFIRKVSRDCELSGAQLPQESRVLLLNASANRDERHWPEPERFDVTRHGVSGHLAFGRGIHGCVGQNLARMEAHALLTALAAKVERIDTGEPTWRLHNMIRVIAGMPVVLHA